MLVYVATTEQIDKAFHLWISETDEDDRRIVHLVYKEFMLSEIANTYNTVSGLISFSLEDWQVKFQQWIDNEILTNPSNANAIRRWSGMLIALISSEWAVRHKLIVRECLEDEFCSELS
jgi:hypothetical protein